MPYPGWIGSDVTLDPRDWGAKYDENSDDTAAIQAAMDTGNSIGGGEVVLPPKLIYVSQLSMRANVLLRGASQFGTRLRRIANGPKAATIVCGQTNAGTANADVFWGLRNLTLDGDKTHDTNGIGAGIFIDPGTRPPTRWGPYGISDITTVQDVLIVNYSDYGFQTANGNNDHEGVYQNVFVAHCNGHGIAVNGSDANFIHTTAAWCGQKNNTHGVYITAAGNKFTACRSWWAGREYDSSGNPITNNANASAWTIDGSAGGVASQLTSLIGCMGQDSAHNGFYLLQASNVQMAGCESDGNPNAAVTLDGSVDCDLDYRVGVSSDGSESNSALIFTNFASGITPARNRIRLHIANGAATTPVTGTQTGGAVIVTPTTQSFTYSRAIENAAQTQTRTSLAALGLIADNTIA